MKIFVKPFLFGTFSLLIGKTFAQERDASGKVIPLLERICTTESIAVAADSTGSVDTLIFHFTDTATCTYEWVWVFDDPTPGVQNYCMPSCCFGGSVTCVITPAIYVRCLGPVSTNCYRPNYCWPFSQSERFPQFLPCITANRIGYDEEIVPPYPQLEKEIKIYCDETLYWLEKLNRNHRQHEIFTQDGNWPSNSRKNNLPENKKDHFPKKDIDLIAGSPTRVTIRRK